MAITRVFRVEIHPELREEFEERFATVSVHVAESADGARSVMIYRPTKWAPNEYAMISEWRDEAALQNFVGENWNRAVIPEGMEKFARKCSVHHIEAWK